MADLDAGQIVSEHIAREEFVNQARETLAADIADRLAASPHVTLLGLTHATLLDVACRMVPMLEDAVRFQTQEQERLQRVEDERVAIEQEQQQVPPPPTEEEIAQLTADHRDANSENDLRRLGLDRDVSGENDPDRRAAAMDTDDIPVTDDTRPPQD